MKKFWFRQKIENLYGWLKPGRRHIILSRNYKPLRCESYPCRTWSYIQLEMTDCVEKLPGRYPSPDYNWLNGVEVVIGQFEAQEFFSFLEVYYEDFFHFCYVRLSNGKILSQSSATAFVFRIDPGLSGVISVVAHGTRIAATGLRGLIRYRKFYQATDVYLNALPEEER